MKKLNSLDWVSLILIFIGGLNWGAVGFFNFDIVGAIFGQGSFLARLVFAVVGISALYFLVMTAPKIAGIGEENSMRTAHKSTH